MQRSLFAELKRRNVWRAAALYAAAAWLLVQVATQVFPFFDVPGWVVRAIVVAAALGFPFWIAFAWLYEVTPEGLRRESGVERGASVTQRTGKTLDRWIIGTLALAVVLLLTNTFVWHKGAGLAQAPAGAAGAASTSGGDAGATAAAAPAGSIAVLPFDNLSSDKEQEYFADGISEDLLDLLAKVPALRVAARTSSFSFKGKELKVQEIARQLNVAHVLEGSVRRAGGEVRVTARLVHAADGYELWSQSWDRKLDDVFAIQDEIASDVVKQLQVKLLGAAPTARETDPRAYALFLQAREMSRHFTAEAMLRSDSLFQAALAIDPRYTAAWTELASNANSEASLGVLSAGEGYRRAHGAVEKARAIDPDYVQVPATLGLLAFIEGDLAGAARQLERALALDPTDLFALRHSTALLLSLGRVPEAIPIAEFRLARDPVNPEAYNGLAISYSAAGRYGEAIAHFRTSLRLRPGRAEVHYQIATALLLEGDAAGALAEMQQEPSEPWRLMGLPMVYHALGRNAEADAALAALIRKYPKDAPYNIAYVYAYRGEADRAFEWLEKAVEYSDPGLSTITTETLFDKIRSDPRWLPFLRKIGKAPEQLEKIRFRVTLPAASGAAPGAE